MTEGRRRSVGPPLAFVAGVLLIVHGVQAGNGPPQPAGVSVGGVSGPVGRPLARSVPVRVEIGSVSVKAPVVPVGLDAHGAVAVPGGDGEDVVGWWRGGVTPGEKGTSVLVGHVDGSWGPAVFYELGSVLPGQSVVVRRADGSAARFLVDAVRVYQREGFPDREVYGDTGLPELRIMTCGGTYSAATHYSGNIVVFAHLTP